MVGTRGRGRVAARLGALAFSAAFALSLTGGAGAATSGDRATTHAYLLATIAFERTTLANERAGSAAQSTLAARLEHECTGVLAHASQEGGEVVPGKLSARARGERDRTQHQLSLLQSEFGHAMSAAELTPDRAAILAYGQTVRSLSWSSATLTAALRLPAEGAELLSAPTSFDVCADMRSWVASGYRKLTAATIVSEEAAEALFGALLGAALSEQTGSAETLLNASEGPAERLLARRLSDLSNRIAESSAHREVRAHRAARALGLQSGSEAPEQGVVIARGATDDGGHYKLRVLRGPEFLNGRCRRMIEVEYESSNLLGSFSSGSTSGVCGPNAPRAIVGCMEGALTVEALAPAAARSARLRLADGRVITTPVTRIPAKLGGPRGFYFQAVKGPRPLPISLTLLDGTGKPLETIALHPPRDCHRHSESQSATLARGTTPSGVAFIVSASYSKSRHGRHLSLWGGPIGELLGTGESGSAQRSSSIYRWQSSLACPPHEAAIFYGQLTGAASTVTAQTTSGEVPLTVVALPASLHDSGRVAYGAFDRPPTALTVRDAAGRVLQHEDLTAFATEHREYCEGYAEPSS